MIIKYYTDSDLAYANRKRRRSIASYTTTLTENQKAVKLGDGATTSIITSEANLCNYVTIGDTRWYVVSYTYLNGGQVELNLRRDVIGEFGLEGCVGKIERGYTETFLRNRKELSLNQMLIQRIPIKSTSNSYGNYTVSTHVDEKWGVLYFTKPTELDAQGNPGNKYGNRPVLNIPAYSPDIVGYPYISNNTVYTTNVLNRVPFLLQFYAKLNLGDLYQCKYIFTYNNETNKWQWNLQMTNVENTGITPGYFNFTYSQSGQAALRIILNSLPIHYLSPLGYSSDLGLYVVSSNLPNKDYNNVCIKHDEDEDETEETIRYSIIKEQDRIYKTDAQFKTLFMNFNWKHNSTSVTITDYNGFVGTGGTGTATTYYRDKYTYTVLSASEAGNITLEINKSFVDEPYIIYVIPLYNVTITRSGQTTRVVNMNDAFQLFNTIIQYTTGENSYLVDAQIYPYCPVLINEVSVLNDIPMYSINSTSFDTNIEVELLPYKDIKKEYIKREYSIVSPDQSGTFKFNYYDYTNNIVEEEGDDVRNYGKLNITIRTALKPLNIISSAIVVPDVDSLKGIPYDSDLRGCMTTSNGFEVSLSTDVFQQYVRNNSNYKAIFSLQREELQKTHEVERVNEKTSQVVNTLTATMMGAIGGGAMADVSVFGTKASLAGAVAGAATAGSVVGTQMDKQYKYNEKLRAYEEYLQQANFDLQIGTIKNIPNQVSRISSFNEIIMRDFYYVIEVYECSNAESLLVDEFVERYAYGLGIIGLYDNFKKNNWFLRGTLITSNFTPILHLLAEKELMGGIYYIYE